MLDASVVSSGEFVLDPLGVAAEIEAADLVVTGEGSWDTQTLGGKGPMLVASKAAEHGIPVVAVAGRAVLGEPAMRRLGVVRRYTLTALQPNLDRSMRDAARLLERAGQAIGADLEQLCAAPR